ncbi:hypothetical protein Nepgr_029825 [Nepenthes gracilis]|uniref:Uncharacterized protein n=1 Tax=Nepenthes gracilis TaxID=150966 RepID=A0AAD3TEM1_NEPGR|nr:hypothetical protein Nepgr_029825 [Nepenthes gracilis]
MGEHFFFRLLDFWRLELELPPSLEGDKPSMGKGGGISKRTHGASNCFHISAMFFRSMPILVHGFGSPLGWSARTPTGEEPIAVEHTTSS